MLLETINARFGIPGLYGFMLATSMFAYFIMSGASYLYFFVLKKSRYHPQYRQDRSVILRSMKWAFISAAGNSALVIPVELMIIKGNSQVYFDVSEKGWGYLAVSILLVLVIAETLIYWIHRALHTPWLYQHLHRFHHQFREPTPFVSVSFHPLDAFFQASPYHLCALFLPVHVWVYHGFIILAMIWATVIHDRVRLVSTELVNHTGCHTVHHWYFGFNYGQFFTFWDRLCGTYRNAACLPEKFAASWPSGVTARQAIIEEGGGS